MKLGFNIGLWGLIMLSALPVSAQISVFSDAYSKWRAATLLEKSAAFIPTLLPGSEVVKALHHQKKYVLHKRITGEVFAVEWLFEAENAQLNSDRSLEKQLAGMFLWALDNQFDELLWSMSNRPSFKMKSQNLFYNRDSQRELLEKWEKQKLNFHYESGNHLGKLHFIHQADTLFLIEIQPNLADVFGGETNIFAEYLFQSLDEPTLPRLHTAYEPINDESASIGMIANPNDWEKTERAWLSGDFTELELSENTSLQVKVVTRDTLSYQTVDGVEEIITHLYHFLTALGEKPSLGLLSETSSKTRLLALFTHTNLRYEHVMRIEQGRNVMNQINSISLLIMPLNSIQKTISELETP
jgi:hypothetical protein